MLCVGCGKSLSHCSKTRKKLGDESKASNQETRLRVLSMWREIAAETMMHQHSTLDGSLLMMCSNCFSDYNRLAQLKDKINANIAVAAELWNTSGEIPSKRP